MIVDPEQPEVIADEHGLIPEPRVPVQHDGHGVLTEVPQIPDDSNH